MLEKLDLPFHGNLHSGLDDATNIGRIVIELIKVNKYFYQKLILKGNQFQKSRNSLIFLLS